MIKSSMNQIWLAFLTGLTTGGISCLAVQGGLLATSITEDNRYKHVGIFLITKLVAYTILGFLLGAIGSALIISSNLQAWMQICIGIFIIITALRQIGRAPRLNSSHQIISYAVFCLKKK